jgi:hypothetical protein
MFNQCGNIASIFFKSIYFIGGNISSKSNRIWLIFFFGYSKYLVHEVCTLIIFIKTKGLL